MKLRIVPTDLKTANDFVRRLHRHSRPVVGYKFAVGVEDETGTLRGVAVSQAEVIDVCKRATNWAEIRAEHFPMHGFHS